MGDLACSQSKGVILTPKGRMAVTQRRLRSNLARATEQSVCEFKGACGTYVRLKLPTSTLARLCSGSCLRPLQQENLLHSIHKRVVFIRKPSRGL